MAGGSRAGGWLLMGGGTLLIGLMAYVLSMDPGGDGGSSGAREASEIEVFLPDVEDWADFRAGLKACVARGLASLVEEKPDEIVMSTKRHGHPVRFVWRRVAGIEATRDEVAKLLQGDHPPIGFVGSNNTVLTAALADGLRRELALRPEEVSPPALLVPWATSVEVEQPGAEGARSALLDLYPGRIFRFCPNNDAMASLLVKRVAAGPGGQRPSRALVLTDRHDPYSRDLSQGFVRAIEAGMPEVEVDRLEGALSDPMAQTGEEPGPAERRLAGRVERWLAEGPAEEAGDGPVWVVLPLQGKPTRRMLRALRDRPAIAELGSRGELEILCGDGIGEDSLMELAEGNDLRIWCVSSGRLPKESEEPLPGGVLLSAEIVAAILGSIDRDEDRPDRVELRPSAAGADVFGRTVAFDEAGERQGDGLGFVMVLEPGAREVSGYGLEADSSWSGPTRVDVSAVTSR